MWIQYQRVGEVLLSGYLFHFLPFFFVDRTLFLHHYLPAYAFKVKQTICLGILGMEDNFYHFFCLQVMLSSFVALHCLQALCHLTPMASRAIALKRYAVKLTVGLILLWLLLAFAVFSRLCVLSYGFIPLTADQVRALRWKDTWDLIIHKP